MAGLGTEVALGAPLFPSPLPLLPSPSSTASPTVPAASPAAPPAAAGEEAAQRVERLLKNAHAVQRKTLWVAAAEALLNCARHGCRPARVLDIGAANARYLPTLLSAARGAPFDALEAYTAQDVVAPWPTQAAQFELALDNADVAIGVLCGRSITDVELPLPHGLTFVMANMCVQHWWWDVGRDAFLQRLAAAMDDGGVLRIVTYDTEALWERHRATRTMSAVDDAGEAVAMRVHGLEECGEPPDSVYVRRMSVFGRTFSDERIPTVAALCGALRGAFAHVTQVPLNAAEAASMACPGKELAARSLQALCVVYASNSCSAQECAAFERRLGTPTRHTHAYTAGLPRRRRAGVRTRGKRRRRGGLAKRPAQLYAPGASGGAADPPGHPRRMGGQPNPVA